MLVEGLALYLGNLELESAGLARTIGTSESTGTPRRASVDFIEVRQLAEGRSIAQGDEGDTVVSEGREACNGRGLLATTVATGGDEHATELALQLALLPQLAGAIPEGLPLSGEVTEASGYTIKDTIIVSEVIGRNDRIIGLGGRMHLGQDLLGESLGDLIDGSRSTSGFDTFLLSLGHFGDVAVQGVDDNCDVGSH